MPVTSAGGLWQRGAVLLMALVFMLLVALLAGTSVKTAKLETRMVANFQFRESAAQEARAVALAASGPVAHFALDTEVDDRLCPLLPRYQPNNCHRQLLSVADELLAQVEQRRVTYFVQRTAPALSDALLLRLPEGRVSSQVAFDAARFEIHVDIDGSDQQLASAGVIVGIARRVPAGWQ